MKMNYKIFFFLIYVIFSTPCYSDSMVSNIQKRNVDNLYTFSKLYGYVKYFYPSFENNTVDWDKFAVYGISNVIDCNSNKELLDSLRSLFYPLAPYITLNSEQEDYNYQRCSSVKFKQYIYWYHVGVSNINSSYQLYSEMPPPYISGILTVKDKKSVYKPSKKDIIKEMIGDSIFCNIPIALCLDKNSRKGSLKDLNIKLAQVGFTEEDDINIKLAGIIITWNIIQHFYPYEINADWDEVLYGSINKCIQVGNKEEYINILKEMLEHLEDGHCFVIDKNDSRPYYHLPFVINHIDDKFIVTRSFDNKIIVGDEIISFNGKPIEEIIKNEKKYISGNESYKFNRACQYACQSRTAGKCNITYKNNENITENNFEWGIIKNYHDNYKSDYELIKNIGTAWYIDLDKIIISHFEDYTDSLYNADAIIFDLRGGPSNGIDEILKYIIDPKILKKDKWMYTPLTIYPDRKKMKFRKTGWEMDAAERQFEAKIVFLTDINAMSYSESILGYCEADKNITIIGDYTTGANGNVNPFIIPGNIEIWWTGMKVLKHNGEKLHGIGIKPDIIVRPTVEGIRQGRDEVLEKAIEYLKSLEK